MTTQEQIDDLERQINELQIKLGLEQQDKNRLLFDRYKDAKYCYIVKEHVIILSKITSDFELVGGYYPIQAKSIDSVVSIADTGVLYNYVEDSYVSFNGFETPIIISEEEYNKLFNEIEICQGRFRYTMLQLINELKDETSI